MCFYCGWNWFFPAESLCICATFYAGRELFCACGLDWWFLNMTSIFVCSIYLCLNLLNIFRALLEINENFVPFWLFPWFFFQLVLFTIWSYKTALPSEGWANLFPLENQKPLYQRFLPRPVVQAGSSNGSDPPCMHWCKNDASTRKEAPLYFQFSRKWKRKGVMSFAIRFSSNTLHVLPLLFMKLSHIGLNLLS